MQTTTVPAGACSRRGKHSPPECHRQTTSMHLESASQACSISRSSMAAPLQRPDTPAGALLRWQALSARTCYTAPDTSRHLESATILHCGAAAKLTQLGGAPCRLLRKGQTHLQVLARGAKHSPPECYTGPDTSTHLEPASILHRASHRGAVASLLDQSELDGKSFAKARQTCRCLVARR